ncbi:RNA polymerase sigma factor [Leifsonia poae]|uniref:RNA polymerase subunit sigma-24 n=1 Tax=Leifsonia poae TaxID=110933 RepID=A0A9W6HCN3_9MICO|nr:sigma-70 family RNA polymerase sigma factor [Leifsonia poae]GLJ77658.1 RNA polymerase subunit sigma-24 [Leifsonia poae]
MATGIEQAFRDDAPRILGAVARYTGDLLTAEDAVQEAFARAIELETAGRAPDNPAAWITTVARRIAVDTVRKERTTTRALPALAAEARRTADMPMPENTETTFTGDERLELILLLCHPEVSEEARVALALRFVCGVPTRDVAAVFLVQEATMAARLTRAKKRIHDSSIRFAIDDEADVTARFPDALTTIYLLFTVGHAAPDDRVRADAIVLARDAHRIRSGDAEAAGLLALLLLTEARQSTRLTPGGEFVTLSEADRGGWNVAMMIEGERLATSALAGRGRFALQAGIAGLHAIAPTWADTDWPSIARLYDRLVEEWPSPSARLGRIVARGYSPDVGPEAALAELDAEPLFFDSVLAPQGYAARGDLARLAGDHATARRAYRRAIELEPNARARRFLETRVAGLGR